MFDNPFLDGTVGNRNKHQQLDHLLRITAPHERLILAGIGLGLLALVTLTLFGTFFSSVTVDGVLLKPGPRHEMVATESGYLIEFLVVPGDRVEAGDPIVRQSVPELERETASLRDRLKMLETELQESDKKRMEWHSLLTSIQGTLLQMEAQHSARKFIVSPLAGEIMALRSDPGEYLRVGTNVVQLRNAEDQPLQAVLFVASSMAKQVQPGMRASVEIMTPTGATRRLDGEVASVTAGPFPSWLAALRPSVTDSMHRVDVVLPRASDLSVPDGTPCRVRILLGQRMLITLLGFGRL